LNRRRRALKFEISLQLPKLVAGAWAVASLTAPARASELRWDGDPACLDRDQLRFEIERALGKLLSASR